MMMKRTADRLLGDNYHWSVLGAGANQMRVASIAAAMGGNVRVGMEDSLWIGAGKLAESNAQQVTQVRKILEGLGLEIATSDEAREILSLKGGDKVAFGTALEQRQRFRLLLHARNLPKAEGESRNGLARRRQPRHIAR